MASVPPIAARESSAAHQSGFGRWLLVLAAGLVVVSVLGYRVLSKNRSLAADAEVATAAPRARGNRCSLGRRNRRARIRRRRVRHSPQQSSPNQPLRGPHPPLRHRLPLPQRLPLPIQLLPAASASAAPLPAPATEIRKVTVKSKPPKVRFFHFGRPVGTTPFVLELKPGERHAYEAGLPGYGTRKIVIDGSKPEVVVGLTRATP